jgi:UDP-glucose 4-epimerase
MSAKGTSPLRRILVTGGAGFIGSHLVDFLVSQKLGQIVVIDNLKRGRLGNLAKSIDRIEFIDGDIRNRELIERGTQGIDIIFHLAAQSNVLGAVEDVDYSFTSNVAGTLEVLRAAKQSGVRRMVFTSSREVYGEPASLPVPENAPIAPKNAYGASKAAAEMYCQVLANGGLTVSVVRLANVYGARDFDRVIPIFLERALRDEPLTIYGGQQILDFVWIDTVVQALLQACDIREFPGPINVGSGKPTTIMELATKIVAMTGSRSEISVESQRAVEVSRFIASTEQMQRVLGIIPEPNPLSHLARLVQGPDASSLPDTEDDLTHTKARGVGN